MKSIIEDGRIDLSEIEILKYKKQCIYYDNVLSSTYKNKDVPMNSIF